jgi:hypothetical protein
VFKNPLFTFADCSLWNDHLTTTTKGANIMHMDADCDVAAAEKETSFFMRDKAIMLNFKNQPGDKDRTQFYNYQNSAKITKTS